MSFPKQKKPRSWRVLQDWIRHYADQEELPQSRVRRAVSFMLVALPLDRSLDEEGNPLFLVKGGVSMELRLKMRARTTKDLDTVYRGTFEHWLGSLAKERLGAVLAVLAEARRSLCRLHQQAEWTGCIAGARIA